MIVLGFFSGFDFIESLVLLAVVIIPGGLPAILVRPVRSARRLAAWLASAWGVMLTLLLVGFTIAFAQTLSRGEGSLVATLVLLVMSCLAIFVAGLTWNVLSGLVAAHRLHRFQFEELSINPVECVRFRTKGPPVTWSPRKLAITTCLAGAPLVCFLLVAAVKSALGPNAWWNILFVLPLGLAAWSWPTLRQRLLASAAEAKRRDPRPPVLLLRSFQDDVLPLDLKASRRRGNRPTTFEELLTGQLWCRGPVIAIGRPGEAVPPVGAARDYFSDETWQSEAEQMVRQSQTIAMIVGTTEGLGWEVRRVHQLQMMGKLALVFPPVSDDDSAPRWQGFLSHIVEQQLADSLQDVPPEQALFVVFPQDAPPVCFTINQRREADAYQIALAATVQVTSISA